MKRITWNKQNCNLLTELFDAGKTDIQIAEIFDCGTYAITKQRSNLGITHFKQLRGGTKRKKSQVLTITKPFYALFYRKDDQNHFSYIDSQNEQLAKEAAKTIMYKQGVDTVTILQPVTKMIIERITEIKI